MSISSLLGGNNLPKFHLALEQQKLHHDAKLIPATPLLLRKDLHKISSHL